MGVFDRAGDLLRLNWLRGFVDSRLGDTLEADLDRFKPIPETHQQTLGKSFYIQCMNGVCEISTQTVEILRQT